MGLRDKWKEENLLENNKEHKNIQDFPVMPKQQMTGNNSKQKFRPIKAILCRLTEELHKKKELTGKWLYTL